MSDVPPPGLSGFFERMTQFLDGRAPLGEVLDGLGASPSGTHRFEFYRDLMAANRQRILRHLYPATSAWLKAAGEAWPALCAAYGAEHRSEHWDLNQEGAAFPTFLQARFPDDAVHELADLEWTSFELAVHPTRFDPAKDATNPATEVRMYTHRVDKYRAADGGPLEAEPVTLLLYRHPETDQVHRFQPSRDGLVAFAVARGELAAADAAAAGIDADALETAQAHLRRVGLLGMVPA